MANSVFDFSNSSQQVPRSPLQHPFSIVANPGTDLWRKPPSTSRFNVPFLHTRAVPLASLQSARVRVRANWKTLYDQGGLALIIFPAGELPLPSGTSNEGSSALAGSTVGSSARDDVHKCKWIKAGVEFTHGRPHVSVVATERWADWSLSPMPHSEDNGVTIELLREKDGSLWIYVVEDSGDKRPVREVTWAFDGQQQAQCWVGAFAAKPSEEAGDLEVHFDGLEVGIA